MEPKLHTEDANVGEVYTPELPEGVDTLTAEMVNLPEGFKGRIVIPEGVRKIDKECFKGKPVTAVSFPKTLREIGEFAFWECRLTALHIEGEEGKIKIEVGAFTHNHELTAITLGNCDLDQWVFKGCPVSKIMFTDECTTHKEDDTLGFGICTNPYSDNSFGTVINKYGGALGTYALKGKLARTDYKPDGDFKGCSECEDNRCYTLAGCEDD